MTGNDMKQLHLGAQFFLNHLFEEDEFRRQGRELAATGYQTRYTHARAGLLTLYLSEIWVKAIKAIEAMAELAAKCGVSLSNWGKDYYLSQEFGGRVICGGPGKRDCWSNVAAGHLGLVTIGQGSGGKD